MKQAIMSDTSHLYRSSLRIAANIRNCRLGSGDLFHRGAERGPGAGIQVAEDALLPAKLGVLLQVLGSLEVYAAGMAHRGRQRHPRDQFGIGGFILHRAAGTVFWLPRLRSSFRKLDMAAQRPLVWLVLLIEGVVVVAQETLRGGEVHPALVLRHQHVPTDVAGVGADAQVRDRI